MKRETGRWEVRDDAGRLRTLIRYTDDHNTPSHDRGQLAAPDLNELVTADGEHVNYIEHGEYRIVRGGSTLRSDDPGAP
jgi:hypothetical protein